MHFASVLGVCPTMLGRLLMSRAGRVSQPALLRRASRALCSAAPSLEHVSAALGLSETDERRRQLHLMMLEYTEMQISGARVPDAVSTDDWAELLRLESLSKRRKYFGYLFKREKAQLADIARRARRAEERREKLANLPLPPPGQLRYGLGHNTIFHRISESTMKSWEEQRLYTAMQFGQPLVVDLSFEPNMNRRENKNTAQQLCYLFGENRAAPDPFDLHLCNVNPRGEIMEFLRRFVPTVEEPAFPMHIHEAHYLELYPRERLVYLTPHCRHELKEFSHDDVYIVGGLVDLVQGRPLSLAKAKKEGLRMAKLPLQRYLSAGPSFSTSLTLIAMQNILMELKVSGSWERALKHVPRRGLLTPEQRQAQAEKDRRLQVNAQRRRHRWYDAARTAAGGGKSAPPVGGRDWQGRAAGADPSSSSSSGR